MRHAALALGALFASSLAVLPVQADEGLARRRLARLQHLDHRLPLGAGGRARPDSIGAYDLLAVRVDVTLPANGEVLPRTGRIEVDVRAEGAIDQLTFLSFFFLPTEVSLIGGGPLMHARDPETGALTVALRAPARPGQVISLAMDGAFADYCFDATGCSEGGPIRHLVEFGWYPLSADFPVDDRFELTLRLRADRRLTPAATGAREAPERDPAGLLWTYRTERPATLGAFSVGTFDLVPVDATVEVFVPPEHVDNGRLLGTEAVQVVDFYRDLLGPYPFGRLGVAPIPDEAGVGLGPQAQVFLPAIFWLVSPDIEEAALVREVLAHEVAHQYFYNLLGVVDPAEGWMSEAFAEYAAARYSEAVTGTLDHIRLNYWEYILVVDEAADVPLASEALNAADPVTRVAVLYDKGSAVLQQLRQTVPEFDAIMQGYVRRFAGEIVTTRDFERFVEQAAGVDLGRFFQQWVVGAGFPRLQVAVERPRDGARTLTVRVEQLPGRHGPFRGTVPVRGRLPDGTGQAATLELAAGDQTLPLGAAQGLEVDPDLTIFRRVFPEPAADVNLSGVVDGLDLLEVWVAMGRATPDPAWDDTRDPNRDQIVDDRDLDQVMAEFGRGW